MLLSENYNWPVDIWALGCVIAEMYLLKGIFNETTDTDQLIKICSVLGVPTKVIKNTDNNCSITVPSSTVTAFCCMLWIYNSTECLMIYAIVVVQFTTYIAVNTVL